MTFLKTTRVRKHNLNNNRRDPTFTADQTGKNIQPRTASDWRRPQHAATHGQKRVKARH